MRRAILVAAVLGLGACTAGPGVREAPSPAALAAWDRHSERVAALQRWSLAGRVAVKQGESGWTAGLRWRQDDGRYDIRLNAPMGQGAVRVEGHPDQVIMHTSRWGTFEGRDVEAMLREELGWHVPVTGLRYWVRGLPRDGTRAQRRLTPEGRLAWLEQGGWRVEYEAYASADGLAMPEKITLEKGALRVRLVVSHWDIRRPRRSARAGGTDE